MVGGLTALYARHKRKKQILPINRNQWKANRNPYPNMIKMMKIFLEVENRMGPIIQALLNQYRLPLPEMNPNVRKGDTTKKRKE